MKIIIVGDGTVGYTLAEQLSGEEHDVVIIDNNSSVLQQSQELLDVMVVQGNGASLEVQREAGVDNGDVLIAVTMADEVNLLCCILARKLGCKRTIARVRNPEYEQQIQFLREDLGLSLVVNPEKMAAKEIYRLLEFPSFLQCESFAKDKVELVELKIPQNSIIDGVTIENLAGILDLNLLICGVERKEEFTIPSGNFLLQSGDNITMTGATRDFATLLTKLGIAQNKIRNVMILGGGRTTVYLARELIHSHISVKIIENDYNRCRELSEQIPDALIIHGDYRSKELLEEEGLESTDALVALTDMDEENIIISMYAKYKGVKKVISKIGRTDYAMMFKEKGLESIVFPTLLTAGEICGYVRSMNNSMGGEVLSMHKIIDGKAEVLEFKMNGSVRNLNVPITNLRLKKDILLCCIIRKGTVIIPRGNDVLMEKDTVILVTKADRPIMDFNDIFADEKVGG